MIRRSVAGAILGVSLLLGSLAWSGFLALRTVFEPDRSRQVAEELLDNDNVRSQLAANLGSSLDALIPSEVPVPEGAVEQAASAALDDPAVRELLLVAFADTHRAFLGDGEAPSEIDLSAVAESVRTSLVTAVPALATVVPAAPALVVPLPTEHVPDASPLRSLLERVVPTMAVLAALGAFFALVFTNDRPGILRRAGFWALGTTAFYLVVGLGLPRLVRRLAPDQGEVVAALLTALLRTTLRPSIVLGVCGAGLLGLSVVWGAPARVARSAGGPKPERPQPRRGAPPARPGAQSQPIGRPDQVDPYPAPVYRPLAAPQPARLPQEPRRQAAAPAPPAPSPRPTPPAPEPAYPPPARGVPRHGSTLDWPTSSPVPEPTAVQSAFEPDRPVAAAAEGASGVEELYRPRWHPDHGWVLHPNDPRPRPQTARWVEDVGWVIPGPPPRRSE